MRAFNQKNYIEKTLWVVNEMFIVANSIDKAIEIYRQFRPNNNEIYKSEKCYNTTKNGTKYYGVLVEKEFEKSQPVMVDNPAAGI